jgi:hypothetical protein
MLYTTTGCRILNNEISLTSVTSLEETDISHFTPYCAQHYFSEDSIHVVLFTDIVSTNY